MPAYDLWGDGSRIERALSRLARAGAILAPYKSGFGVYPRADRRRRPVARISAPGVRALLADGALQAGPDPERYELTPAGHDRLKRTAIAAAPVIAPNADQAPFGPGFAPAITRLHALRNGAGRTFFAASELRVAALLHAAFVRSECGQVRGADWSGVAPSGAARGPAAERGQHHAIAARALVEKALAALGGSARAVTIASILHEQGFEAIERRLGWPARSAKIALKLALQQLAESGVFKTSAG
jgi:hypothetical protein